MYYNTLIRIIFSISCCHYFQHNFSCQATSSNGGGGGGGSTRSNNNFNNLHNRRPIFNIPYGGGRKDVKVRRMVEPVALIAILDIENLQNEVLRLRNILKENDIYFDETDDESDDEIEEVKIKEENKEEYKEETIEEEEEVVDETVEKEEHYKSKDDLPLVIKKEPEEEELDTDTDTNICSYVYAVLNERLIQVNNKKRSKWFSKHYKKYLDTIDGEYTIVSGHGREDQQQQQNEDANIDNSQHTQQQIITIDDNQSSIFPENIMSLDMIFTQEMYNLAIKEIQKKEQNEQLDHGSIYEQEKLFIPKLILRAMHLGFNFTPVTVTLGLAAFSKNFRDSVWYNLVAQCLAKSGPAFIKWGQWASTRSDMFPDALCVALSELHADAPAHNWKTTQKTVEEALCIPKGTLYEVFEEFDHNPVASGSIAQVHRAVIRYDDDDHHHNRNKKKKKMVGGTTVAIKVRHPNVSRLIDMDFRLMSIVADFADRVPALSWLRIRDSVEQFSHTMAAQAHLNVEAHHLEVLNHNFRSWEAVNFPSPLFACSSVIIESFERGEICSTIIDRYDKLAATKHSQNPIIEEAGEENSSANGGHELMPVPLAKFIVTTGLSLYLKMLLVDNLMHADLHPGNIMLDCQIFGKQFGDISPLSSLGDVPVGGASSGCTTVQERKRQDAKTKRTRPKLSNGLYGSITLVDAGMVAQLDENESSNFIGLISALGEGDGRAAAEAILRFNNNQNGDEYEGDLTLLEQESFKQDVIDLFDERCRGYGTNVDFGDVLRGILGIVKIHQVQLGANYATLVVNALCIESLAKRVCPSYNVLDASKPLLKAYGVLPYDNGNNKKGFFTTRPELKRSLIKAFTPILYMRKRRDDDNFFKKIELRRRTKFAQNRKRSGNPIVSFGRLYRNKLHRQVIAVATAALFIHHAVSIVMVGEEPGVRHIRDDELLPKGKEKETNVSSDDSDEVGNDSGINPRRFWL